MRDWQHCFSPLSPPPAHHPCHGYFGRIGAWANGKARTEDGFLGESKEPDSQNHLDWSEHSQGSLPDPHTARFHGTRGQRAEWMVTMHRVWADYYRLEQGGLESHVFIYLISKTAVSPYSCLYNNGALYSQCNKKLALARLHHITVQPGMKDPLKKSQQQFLRWCLRGTDLEKTLDRDGWWFTSSTRGQGMANSSLFMLHFAPGMQSRAFIYWGASHSQLHVVINTQPLVSPMALWFFPQCWQVHNLINAVLSLEIPLYGGYMTSRL